MYNCNDIVLLYNDQLLGDCRMHTIEVKAFGKLWFLFKEREWKQPKVVVLSEPMTADDLREELEIPAEDVEVVFVSHRVMPLSTLLKDGDQMAFVPPGIPTVHRFSLGFYSVKD